MNKFKLTAATLVFASVTSCFSLESESINTFENIFPKSESHSKIKQDFLLESDLFKNGVSILEMSRIIEDPRLKYTPRVKELLNVNPEKSWTYKKYRSNLLTDTRIKLGREFIDENYSLLNKVQEETGVSLYDITAILGIETSYGNPKLMGNFIAFNALYSRYIDFPKNREWMAREMKELINMSNELGIDLFEIKGSFCGCVGIGQFLPTTWANLFIDSNKDGKRDPFNLEETLYSIANHLLDSDYIYNDSKKRYNALFAYNRSDWYVRVILELSDVY
jgi:membrane-bound lytic murein transglycosylase B